MRRRFESRTDWRRLGHAIATYALCEAYRLTRLPRHRRPAQRALDFVAMARNPYMAWRYDPRGGENDTAVTGWCVLALWAGKRARLGPDPDAFEGARQWIDKMTDPDFGVVGYNMPGGGVARYESQGDRFPREKSCATTAAGMLCRMLLGEDPRASDAIRKGTHYCLEKPPVWNRDDGSIDMIYWFHGTRALFQVGGPGWRQWNEALQVAVLPQQRRQGSGSAAGSWDPIGAWGREGGRVYATAMMVLCLETYYHEPRIFGR